MDRMHLKIGETDRTFHYLQVWAILDVTLILTSIIAFTIETEPDFENMMTLLSQNGSDVAHVSF